MITGGANNHVHAEAPQEQLCVSNSAMSGFISDRRLLMQDAVRGHGESHDATFNPVLLGHLSNSISHCCGSNVAMRCMILSRSHLMQDAGGGHGDHGGARMLLQSCAA